MATIEGCFGKVPEQKGSKSFSFCKFLLFIVAIGLCFCVCKNYFQKDNVGFTDQELSNILLVVEIDPSYSHSLEEHPDTAPLVHQCLNQKGAYVTFQIEKNKRYLRACVIDDNTIGFQIVDVIKRVAKERTAYVREDFKCIKDIFDYAKRMNYARFKGTF